jgi:putative ABC transport system permease protein
MSGINVRQLLRLLSKDLALFITVAVIMALSIGSSTAVFSLVKAALFTDLGYRDAKRLAVIWHSQANSPEVIGVWARDYQTYRDTLRTFQTVAAFTNQGYNLSLVSEPARITCSRATSNLLPMLGVVPVRGRWFSAEEDRAGTNPTIVLNYDMWQARFGGDDAIIGKTIRLDLKPYTVIGVMPSSFVFPPRGIRLAAKSECWVPASFTTGELATPGFNWVVLGRMNPGVSVEQAQQDAAIVAQRILESYPAAVQKEVALRARIIPLQLEVTGRTRTPLFVFAGSVGLLLLIGCANVANLILTKLHIRQREIAVRAAIGATRASLTMQLLLESVVLALCGGLPGIPLAFGLLRLLVALSPASIPADRIHMDTAALFFSVICSVASGILAGLAPAFRAGNVDIVETMAEGARSAAGGLRHSRLRAALAVSEIALALALFIGAGLLLRSFAKLANVSPGFDPRNVLTFSVALPEENYKRPEDVKRFVDRVLDGMQSGNGVTVASAGTGLPMGDAEATVFSRVGAPATSAGFKAAAVQTVTPEYLRTFGIHVERGRPIETGDDVSRMPVALVSESMAERYWPETEVLGKQFFWLVGGKVLTVVGVVADVRQGGLASPATPTFYVPLGQSPQINRNLAFAARTSQPAPALSTIVRHVVSDADPALPVFALRSAEDVVGSSISNERFNMFVVVAFAVCAVTISVLGLYAVISYVVIHSWSELGIRMALGATPRSILGMVVFRGFKFVSIGVLIGTGIALMLTQFMKGMLFGISETDNVTFVCVIASLCAVALVAIMVPAIRAMKVDPVACLSQTQR